jgi:hypothetical protein
VDAGRNGSTDFARRANQLAWLAEDGRGRSLELRRNYNLRGCQGVSTLQAGAQIENFFVEVRFGTRMRHSDDSSVAVLARYRTQAAGCRNGYQLIANKGDFHEVHQYLDCTSRHL